jgi:diguanylate cyclase (GGDEF)-like protein
MNRGSIEENADYQKHYDLLQEIGVFFDLEQQQRDIVRLEELVSEAIDMLSKHTVPEVIQFAISRFLQRFTPKHLVFAFQEPYNSRIRTYHYEDLKETEAEVPIHGLPSLKRFFESYPMPISFSLLEYKLEEQSVTDPLLRYEPEFLVPLTGIGGVQGFILFSRKVVESGYSQQEIEYVHRLLKFLSIAVQNILHHESSITDFKTRVFNHSYFKKRLDEEIARIGRHRTQIGVLLLDIDDFKVLNDTYGHLAGDEVLSAVAGMLKSTVRAEDVVARFGGEEFVVLAIEAGSAGLFELGERIRRRIAGLRVRWSNTELSVTVSVGGAHMCYDTRCEAVDFLDRADGALYRSKSHGKNMTSMQNTGLLFRATRGG